MNYNTQRGKLELSEYGRNVQNMIEYTLTIEDDEKRNQLANSIIDLMGQMNPHLRNVEEFRAKLWDHLIIMSDFRLKVNSPYPYPEREALYERPKALPYPQTNIKEKHYGKNVNSLIAKARAMDDPEKKEAFAEVIGNYMKLVHNNWNQDSVNNEVIYGDLERMSEGQLKLTEDANLDLLAKTTRTPQQQNTGGKKKFQNKGGQNQGGGQNQNRNKNFKKRPYQNNNPKPQPGQ
jgi:hypothetical protein